MTHAAQMYRNRIQNTWIHQLMAWLVNGFKANVRRSHAMLKWTWTTISSVWRYHARVASVLRNSVPVFGVLAGALWALAGFCMIVFLAAALLIVLMGFEFLMGIAQAMYSMAIVFFNFAYVFTLITVAVFVIASLVTGMSQMIEDQS